jgi:integrase/recombinase XerD
MARVKMRHVNSFYDRHGRLRHQCRIPGQKSFLLPGVPGSAEFMEAHQVALAGAAIPIREIGASRTKAGTVNAAIVAYYKDDAFTKSLALTTQAMRRPILERFRAQHGDKRIALLQGVHIVTLLKGMKPYAQKNWRKTLRGLMAFAIAENMRADDPTAGVKVVKVPKSKGHMTWLEPEVELYRGYHKIGTVARLALELMLNIAGRREDAHLLGRQHIKDGKLVWRPIKTQRTTNKQLKVRLLPEFQEALDAMPRADDALRFLTTDYGKAFKSPAAFGNKFADWCDAAGLKPVLCTDGVTRNFRAHGLRKASLRAAAHAGCTGSELMALSGHSSLAQLQVYLDEVDQEKLADAAFAKLMASRTKKTKKATPTYKPSDLDLQTGT